METGFDLKNKGDIPFLQIPAFNKTGLVKHGFSTRQGGVSPEPFYSMNLAGHVGDSLENMRENRRLFSSVLGLSPEHWVTAQQVHGTAVRVVSACDAGRGALDYDGALADTDALITSEPEVPLATFYADCVPVFFLDPVTPAIGIAHAGWKGTVGKIPAITLREMAKQFGTKAEDCLVGIGPSIGPCCYEVDKFVADQVVQAFGQDDYLLRPIGPGKWLLDLWQANRQELLRAGVQEQNITVAGLCTCCNPELLFSYRAESGVTGRMGGLIALSRRS
ncbi:MAG TPA: peptidoglycan editing factor PgeF [Bacillota bacterium]|nr:peptidoglycan editing factor PgeF [Bacillota bacterium]